MPVYTMKVHSPASNKDHPHFVFLGCRNKPVNCFNKLTCRKGHNFTFAHGDRYENFDRAPLLWVGKDLGTVQTFAGKPLAGRQGPSPWPQLIMKHNCTAPNQRGYHQPGKYLLKGWLSPE
jgi:hypothetical protein